MRICQGGGSGGDEEKLLLKWLTHSHDLTPCDFFLVFCEKTSLCLSFSYKHGGTQAKNQCCIGNLSKTCCSMFGRSWTTNMMGAVSEAVHLFENLEIHSGNLHTFEFFIRILTNETYFAQH